MGDAGRRGSTLADQLTEFRLGTEFHLGAKVLAETPEISNYLTNRNLGMSLRYGLNTNIYDIGERFWRQIREMANRGRLPFSRFSAAA